jgi:hypothetical protein
VTIARDEGDRGFGMLERRENRFAGARTSGLRALAYALVAGLAALTSVGIWMLTVIDEGRSAGAATVDMVVKFTNLTVLLVGVVAAWIASGWSPGRVRAIAHLTVMVMAAVTAIVNATLLDPALPPGWWGVFDLSQHYVVPVAVVAAWAFLGPAPDVPRRSLAWVLAVPSAWLVLALARGESTGSYPYDFLDVGERGWPTVLAMVAAILALMVALAAGGSAIDRHRDRHRPASGC